MIATIAVAMIAAIVAIIWKPGLILLLSSGNRLTVGKYCNALLIILTWNLRIINTNLLFRIVVPLKRSFSTYSVQQGRSIIPCPKQGLFTGPYKILTGETTTRNIHNIRVL